MSVAPVVEVGHVRNRRSQEPRVDQSRAGRADDVRLAAQERSRRNGAAADPHNSRVESVFWIEPEARGQDRDRVPGAGTAENADKLFRGKYILRRQALKESNHDQSQASPVASLERKNFFRTTLNHFACGLLPPFPPSTI